MRFAGLMAVGLIAALLSGCSSMASEAVTAAGVNLTPLSASITFDKNDTETEYNEKKAIRINLTGTSAKCASGYVEIAGNCVTIAKAGTYIISGSLDGMIIVHADKQDTVRIVLDNADIASPDSAAIYVRSARKVVITCAGGSKNHLSNGGKYIDIDESNIDSVIFSKDDLTINGSGLMEIDAQAGHGIVSKDSLRISDANIVISAASHAISAKDDIGIDGGTYKLNSTKDAIHAENKDDAESGNMLILGGEFDLISGGDGLSASNILQVDDGTFSIEAGGGYENAAPHADDFMRFRSNVSASDESAVSCKAIKSGSEMVVNGGTFTIDSADDALHADANLRISSGSFGIRSGDDALHAENNLGVYGGEFDIESCYEGLEGHTIDVFGGNIELYSSDDGMNAAGGNDGSGMGEDFRMDNPFISDPDAYIHISGGSISIHCIGDGIDSNGEIRISGGETYVHGPSGGANGSLDCGTEAYIDSGLFIAVGSASMAERFSDESAQCSIILSARGGAGGRFSILDADGETLTEFTSECDFQCIVMSMPGFTLGESYAITSGENRLEFTFDSKLFTNSANLGSGGMMNPGGRMQMPQQGHFPGNMDGSFQPPSGFEPPPGAQMPDDTKYTGNFRRNEQKQHPTQIQQEEDT